MKKSADFQSSASEETGRPTTSPISFNVIQPECRPHEYPIVQIRRGGILVLIGFTAKMKNVVYSARRY
jgi:hypothetical protein